MKKSTVKKIVEKLTAAEPSERNFKIIDGAIKDGFCNWGFEIIRGVGIGNKYGAKGKCGLIKDDMKDAFAVLNVHLAYIDDVFKHANNEVQDIDTMHNDELTTLYSVSGFKIQGGDDNESIILIGNKYVSGGGRISLETPKIALDEGSSYKWYNELKAASDKVREEVALYSEGKYIPVEEDIEEEDPAQIKMSFKKGGDVDMSDFENAEA